MRELLYNWAKESHIVLGKKSDWNAAARNVKREGEFAHVNLWMDSTDIAIERGKDRGRKSDYWSGKLRRPGVRFVSCLSATLTELLESFGDGIVQRCTILTLWICSKNGLKKLSMMQL